MAKIVCQKQHFGKGGELVTAGTESDGKADGVYWAEKGKTLEVATPKKQKSDDKPKKGDS